MFKVDALMGALRVAIQEIGKLNFGRKDSRVLRLLCRELAAAEDVAAALLRKNPQLSISSPNSPCTKRAGSPFIPANP